MAIDDGGCSGGNVDRPALQRFLADLRAGMIATRLLGAGRPLRFLKRISAFQAARRWYRDQKEK
jgi:hypothetical protein